MHASPLFAGAVARLLCRVDEALGRPAALDFVDMAAGRGELAGGVLAALPADVAARTRAYAVEIAERPAGLDHRIEWLAEPPGRDDRPAVRQRVAGQRTRGGRGGGLRGRGPAGAGPSGRDRAARGAGRRGAGAVAGSGGGRCRARRGCGPRSACPGTRPGPRRSRRSAGGSRSPWTTRTRRARRPPFGTLTGFREGRETTAVPDGSCDITAHVALDACALPRRRACSPSARRCAPWASPAHAPRSRWPPRTPPPTYAPSRAPVRPPSSPRRAGSGTSGGWSSRWGSPTCSPGR